MLTMSALAEEQLSAQPRKRCKVGTRREIRLERMLRESMKTIRKQKMMIKRLQEENANLRGGGLLDGVTSEASSIASDGLSESSVVERVDSVSDLKLLSPQTDVRNIALRERSSPPPSLNLRCLSEPVMQFPTPARILPSYKGKEEFLFRSGTEEQFASWVEAERLRRIYAQHPHLRRRNNSFVDPVEHKIDIGALPQPTCDIPEQQHDEVIYSSEDEAMIGWC
eukprot:TRINITY_DN13658_c0_g1_i1.p1 TRINITY_DN13658_c0_g1~~TRINITY_DN13658_c0_g1_i1.p1  ORF type:complete len:239 (+),score=47.31 TRINITY_DN13658_c0_g1_i1:47-718(+)